MRGPDGSTVRPRALQEPIEPRYLSLERIDAVRVAPAALPVTFPGISRIGHRFAEPAGRSAFASVTATEPNAAFTNTSM